MIDTGLPRLNHDAYIPVTVLTGFLGSGKTTLLNALLRDPRLADTAVVVNELGAIGIDHLLVTQGEDNVVLLGAGCLCCTMLNSFKETLADLYARRARGDVPRFSRVLVETTGLADPAPILQCLLRDSFVSHYYRLSALITTVDAVFGEDELREHTECARQVALADRLIITKTDRTEGACPPSLHSAVRVLNPRAPVFESNHGAVPLEAVLPDRVTAHDVEVQPTRPEPVLWHMHASDGEPIRNESFVLNRPVTWSGLAGWMDLTSEFFRSGMLRCKGIVYIAEAARPYLIQGVQGVFAPPLALDGWPDADTRSRLVCITRGVPADHVRTSIECLYAPAGTYRPASIAELMAQQRCS